MDCKIEFKLILLAQFMERRPRGPEAIFMGPLKSFHFDPEKLEFTASEPTKGHVIKLSELNDIFDISRLSTSNFSIDDTKPDDSEMMYLTVAGSLVQMPRLRKWLISLNKLEKEKVGRKTEEVMKQVFNEKIEFKEFRLKRNSITEIKSTIFDGGLFLLRTIGEYSTLGLREMPAMGALHYRDYSREDVTRDHSIPAEFGLHNADRDNGNAKRLSLYAGAGTIAWLAKNSGKL